MHTYIPGVLLGKDFFKLFLLTYWDAVDLWISNKQVQMPVKKEKKEGEEKWGEEMEMAKKKKKKRSITQRSEHEPENNLRTGHRKNAK